MAQRLAAATALIVFAVCLLQGSMQAGNPFHISVMRALIAMLGTFVIGLIVGAMGRIMIEESIQQRKKLAEAELTEETDDR